ncbi:uncharacterized protein LOC111259544 [Varroa jacobsoni]|uniref:uncharacterized protein LOC111259544 n=1 Tax=Varroa jacobsoni TaxID=62625 RepID=UPI000BFA4612|nr:uncharacterized protein LOC111259544 [Varroa jacobsoni]XP_022687372.1 uncharacterized protein LOC111259544 [Varroa jacobsoni]
MAHPKVSLPNSVSSLKVQTRILVIGAGVSGLSAAAELNRKGYGNVKVYEARSRLGGRIHTFTPDLETKSSLEGRPIIELGAQWIHGQEGNSVFETCCAEKAKIGGTLDLLDLDAPIFFENFHYWHQLDKDQNEFMAKLVQTFEDLRDECESLSNDYAGGRSEKEVSRSLLAFLEARFGNLLERETDPDKRKTLVWFFNWAIRLENEINGHEANEISANYFGQFYECKGNITTELGPRGYKAFIDLMLRYIPAETIFTETEVTHIDFSVRPIKVTSTKGIEEFDYVICSLPLGVLKERQSLLFTPELPKCKSMTISALGFGTCNKIYLEFREKDVFWTAGDVFQVLWKDDHLLPGEAVGRRKEWYRSVSRLNAVRHNKRLLVAWIAGSGAREMEALSENEVMTECWKILKMVTDREDLPIPQRIIRSTWFSDPFSRGSYSFISTACDQRLIVKDCWYPHDAYCSLLPATLAEPVFVDDAPVLCFAGEATSDHFYSTVHGAYDSGLREATRIDNYIKAKGAAIHTSIATGDIQDEANQTNTAKNERAQNVTFDALEKKEKIDNSMTSQLAVDNSFESSTDVSACLNLKGHQKDPNEQRISKLTAKINVDNKESVRIADEEREGVGSGAALTKYVDFGNTDSAYSETDHQLEMVGLCSDPNNGNSRLKAATQVLSEPGAFSISSHKGSQAGPSGAGTSTSYTSLPLNTTAPYNIRRGEHFRVIIVGAGAAGLGAALRLTDSTRNTAPNSENLLILEAHSRPGGRILTHYEAAEITGGPLELGAQWVHGEEDNALFEFCRRHSLLSDPRADYSVEGKGVFLLPDGSAVPEELIENKIMVLNSVKNELALLKNSTKEKHQGNSFDYKSVFEMYRRRFEAHVMETYYNQFGSHGTPQSFSAGDPELMSAILDWYRKFEIVDNACEDPEQLAIRGYGDYVECPGVYYINFNNGYESFVRTIVKSLPEGSLRLNAPVSKVIWKRRHENQEVVVVETCDGKVFTCDHLIMTPSVRVLKQFPFQPSLPKFKHEALRCFGFGTIDKIFLVWDDGPFWPEDSLGFQFLWTRYDDDFFKEHGEYLRGIYGFEKVNRRPNVLLGWIGGDHAVKMEKVADTELLRGCYHLLKRFANRVVPGGVRPPSRVIRSAWASDPYVNGAYSHRLLPFDQTNDPVGKLQQPLYSSTNEDNDSATTDLEDIAVGHEEHPQQDRKDLHPLVLFAGEATDPVYFSTVHGALRSGQREAQRLIDYWNCKTSREFT